MNATFDDLRYDQEHCCEGLNAENAHWRRHLSGAGDHYYHIVRGKTHGFPSEDAGKWMVVTTGHVIFNNIQCCAFCGERLG